MDSNFLQNFLRTGLFEIGDNDERLKWLEQSISDLKKVFENDHSTLNKYTLVSLDPNISDTEPAMIETERIVTTYWKTLRDKYTDMPRSIIRGVILNALNEIGISSQTAGRIIYLSGANYYVYSKLNTEKDIASSLLKELGEEAEADAASQWSLAGDDLSLKLSVLKMQELTEPITSTQIETPINRFFTEFKKSLDANLKATFSSLRAVESRNKLLWWREALYSKSLNLGYRDLDMNVLPIVMSTDLYAQVPPVTPISVDYFLRNTILQLIGNSDKSVKFSEYLTIISNGSLKPLLSTYFNEITEEEGRISLRSFIGLLLNGKADIKEFKARTGIDKSESITFSNLAVYLFHDLLIEGLI